MSEQVSDRMPRKHNKVADGLADLTMDKMSIWSKLYNTKLNPKAGHRSEQCAGASVIVGVFGKFEGGTLYEPWYAEGTYIPVEVTVFQTETIALDRALSWLVRKLEQ